MENAVLKINDTNAFENDIWQIDTDDFTADQWKIAINNFADNLQALYDWIDEQDEIVGGEDFDHYVLGDTINMLRSIGIELQERR